MSKLDDLINKLCPDGVEYKKIEDFIDYIQPGKYIVESTEYDDSFETPVLTAGQTFILGYTDETDGIFKASKENPVIIFDDFTAGFHWVDFDFKVKSSAMKILISKNNINFRYFFHVMGKLNIHSTEHTRLWIGTYSQFEIPVPPLEIQNEIVRILDNFTELEEELEEELEARRKQYEYYRDSLLTFDNSVPIKTIGDLFDFKNGLNKDKSAFGEGIPFVKYTDVYKNKKISKSLLTGKVTLTKKEIESFGLKKGDVLFTRCSETKEEVGFASAITEDLGECAYNGFVLRARPKTDLLLPDYCAYCFRTPKIRKEIIRTCSFTTRANTTGVILSKIKIPVPSIDKQKQIVNILDQFEALCNDITSGLPAEIEARHKQYEYYRDKLLTFKRKSA